MEWRQDPTRATSRKVNRLHGKRRPIDSEGAPQKELIDLPPNLQGGNQENLELGGIPTAYRTPTAIERDPYRSREKPTKRGKKNPHGIEAKWRRKKAWAHDSERL